MVQAGNPIISHKFTADPTVLVYDHKVYLYTAHDEAPAELAGNCETNRPAIAEFKGQDYFFYHNGALKDGGSHRRSVCLDYLHYNSDGTIKRGGGMTSEGVDMLIFAK